MQVMRIQWESSILLSRALSTPNRRRNRGSRSSRIRMRPRRMIRTLRSRICPSPAGRLPRPRPWRMNTSRRMEKLREKRSGRTSAGRFWAQKRWTSSTMIPAARLRSIILLTAATLRHITISSTCKVTWSRSLTQMASCRQSMSIPRGARLSPRRAI